MVKAEGESEYSQLLKTHWLLILRDAQNAEHDKIAPNWNVFGTRDFSLLPRNEVGLRSDTRGRPKRSNLAVDFNLEAS
jgi:hypothetical protein